MHVEWHVEWQRAGAARVRAIPQMRHTQRCPRGALSSPVLQAPLARLDNILAGSAGLVVTDDEALCTMGRATVHEVDAMQCCHCPLLNTCP